MPRGGQSGKIAPMGQPAEQLTLNAKKSASSVTELTRRIKGLLEEGIGYVHVWGEASNVRYQQSGHLYFDLKDDQAKIFVAAFRGLASTLKFRVEDGMELYVAGKLTVWEPRGNYQIVASRVEPRGVGALQMAFDQLKAKLEQEGLFAPERKKPLPHLPRRIVIITSPTGAALRDMLNRIEQRFPPLHISIYPVRVQGEGASREIAEAIDDVNRHMTADVMIVGRGGGSLEDLWSFNEEVLARAIAASRIPVISAVGHETDVTIADLVADVRALTPTHAAEIVTPYQYDDLVETLAMMRQRIDADMRKSLTMVESILAKYRDGYALRSPALLAEARRQRLDELTLRIGNALQETVRERQETVEAFDREMSERLQEKISGVDALLAHYRGRMTVQPIAVAASHHEGALQRISSRMDGLLTGARDRAEAEVRRLSRMLDSLSPLRVLSRGYTITLDESTCKPVVDASSVAEGAILRTKYRDGETISRVERIDPS